MNKSEVFQRIRYTMEKKEISQSALAPSLGVDQGHLSVILNQERGSLDLLLKVLQELKLQLKMDGKRVKTIPEVAASINKTTATIYRFSIACLSRRIGVSRRPISALMDGKNVHLDTFFRILEGLNIEIRII